LVECDGYEARDVTEPTADYSTRTESTDAPLTLEARIEALLFVSAAPVPAQRLAEALGVGTGEVEGALPTLEAKLTSRGLRLQRHRGGYTLTTAPPAAADVARLLDLESTAHLTRAALETLSIIAYRQPATRPLIDSIRGVNSEASVHTLVRYGLVEESGRGEGPGRPILYSTTQDFLHHFGLSSLSALPPLDRGESTAESPPSPSDEF
jgi:segregation and condensation protein B